MGPRAGARPCGPVHPDLVLQVDANGSYRAPTTPTHLAGLAEFGVLCVEQPLPPADLVALAQLAEKHAPPRLPRRVLDLRARVRDALRYGACAMACLKPGRLGGMRATRAAHAACAEAGVPAFVGGFFEAGLGRASNLALAARFGQDAAGLVSDLGDPAGYLESTRAGTRRLWTAGCGCPASPGSGSPR